MSNRLPIDPLYHVEAQSLKRNEARRLARHSLPAFNRAARFPLDAEAAWNERWRRMAIFDVCLAVLWVAWMLVLIGVILGA